MEDDIICPYGEDREKVYPCGLFRLLGRGRIHGTGEQGNDSEDAESELKRGEKIGNRAAVCARQSQAGQRDAALRRALGRRKLRFPGGLLLQSAPAASFRLLFPKSSAILFGIPVVFRVFRSVRLLRRVPVSAARRRGSPKKRERSERFLGAGASPLVYIYRHTSQAHTVF